jgi:hypothetical protein
MTRDRGADEEENKTQARTTIQSALKTTISDTAENARAFAAKAGIPESTVSEFRNHRRSVNISTLELMLTALTPDQYEYFLTILVDGHTMLTRALEDGEPLAEDRTQAFLALVASYCNRCSRKEQLKLLSVIYEASSRNPELLPDTNEDS